MRLNREQLRATQCAGNVVVTACPGSGKTRVLSARVIRGIEELPSTRQRVAALTFTNRAADEIRERMDEEDVPTDCLWAGTIHSFALEWVLRPYAPYLETIRYGFTVADEYFCQRVLRETRVQRGLGPFAEVNTAHARDGTVYNADLEAQMTVDLYKQELRRAKVVDYDEVLYLAYQLLADNPEIAANIGAIFRLFCVDEVQDIQDLQYGVLSEIYRASSVHPEMFFVGDSDQSIYESLGALTKSPEEIADEFGMHDLQHFRLVGNYRSTQRLINFYRLFRPQVAQIQSRVDHPQDHGRITFDNQTIHKDQLHQQIARLVRTALDSGVPEQEICIVAPQWAHVRPLAHQLAANLPNVSFDAPGISPFHSARDSLWYKLAKLFLTDPVPAQIRSRIRCAKDVLTELGVLLDSEAPEAIRPARRLLRLVNQLSSSESDGIAYLRDLFTQFLEQSGITLETNSAMKESFDLFFEKAESRLADSPGNMPTSTESFRNIFNYPSGVVVNTCHGIKGEEFDTVIAFGLLKGYVPHWSVIINGSDDEANQRESKLLYVIASRAKRQLHLISEAGRKTRRGASLQTSRLLAEIDFGYDR